MASRPEQAARLRPGIVYVSLCAYGHEGPWANRRGFNSLVQNANGINHAEAEAAGAAQPKPLPVPGDRPCGRLPDGVRRDDGARAARDRRRKLACARFAGADRPLDPRASAACRTASPVPTRGFEDVRDRLEEIRLRLRPAHHGASRRHDGGDAAALGAAVGAARHASGSVARLKLSSRPKRDAREPGSMATDHARVSYVSDPGSRLRSSADDSQQRRRPQAPDRDAVPVAQDRTEKRSSAACSSPDSGRKRAISAAIIDLGGAPCAVLAFERDAEALLRAARAQNTPSAPVFTSTRAPNSRMISVQKRPVPATNQGCAAQAARNRAAALARSGAKPCPVPKRAKACASAVSGTRPGRDRAAVDAALVFRYADAGQRLDRGAHLALHRMAGRHIAVMIDAARAGDADEARMLAGAIVVQRRRRTAGARERLARGLVRGPVRAAFERRAVEPGARQHAARDRDMRRLAAMTGAGKREFLVAEAVAVGRAALDQRQRLQRLHGRARKHRRRDIAEREHASRRRHPPPRPRRGGGSRPGRRARPRPAQDYAFVMLSGGFRAALATVQAETIYTRLS